MDHFTPKSEVDYTIEPFTASDGYRWQYRRYVVRKARAHLVCLHGFQDHGGWYEAPCRHLCQAGFRVTFLERRGCGLNRAARGDAPSFRRLLDDIAEFVLSSRRLETVPTILLGHSWGGNLGIALQRRRKGLMEGLILVCPELFPRLRCSGGPPSLNYTLSRLLAPRRLLPIPFSAPELLTASPYWQEYLREDPLYLRQATARHLAAYARVNRYARGATRHLTVPVMLLLAEQDQFIDNARTRRFVQGLPAEYKHIGEVPSAQHTLAFEPEPNEYLDACISWMGWTYGV